MPRSLVDLLARTMAKSSAERPPPRPRSDSELQRVQGELGLPVTTLPVAQPAAGAEALPPPSAAIAPEAPAGSSPVAVAPIATPQAVPFDDRDDGDTVTIARSAPAPAEPAGPSALPAARRAVIGTAAAVVALLAVLALLWLVGRSDDEPSPTTTGPTGATGPDEFFGEVPVPGGVAVTPGEDGAVVVTWRAVAEVGAGVTYLVQRTDVTPTPPAVHAEEPRAVVSGIQAGARPCFTVTAVSAAGQLSAPSATRCL